MSAFSATSWSDWMTKGQTPSASSDSCGGCSGDAPCDSCGGSRQHEDHHRLSWAATQAMQPGLSPFWRLATFTDAYFKANANGGMPTQDSDVTKAVAFGRDALPFFADEGARLTARRWYTYDPNPNDPGFYVDPNTGVARPRRKANDPEDLRLNEPDEPPPVPVPLPLPPPPPPPTPLPLPLPPIPRDWTPPSEPLGETVLARTCCCVPLDVLAICIRRRLMECIQTQDYNQT